MSSRRTWTEPTSRPVPHVVTGTAQAKSTSDQRRFLLPCGAAADRASSGTFPATCGVAGTVGVVLFVVCGSVITPAVTGGPAEERFHLGAVEGRPRILVIAGESVIAVVVLSHQLAQSPLRPGVSRRDQAHLVAAARPFQRRAVRSANVTGVDVAPEVCLAEARVVPLCLEPVVAVRSDDIVDAQPYPGRLRVADRDRVRDHFAEVLAQGVSIRGRMPLGFIERDLAGNCALGQQAG